MSDTDVFGKLSRIFETHGFTNNDSALSEILEDFDPSLAEAATAHTNLSQQRLAGSNASPTGKDHGGKSGTGLGSSPGNGKSPKPTPYEVWQEKNADKIFKKKAVPKLNGQQWDRLVDKMHQANRQKQSSMINEQNHGLAAELEGYSFQPRINKTSQELSATMKSLSLRVPEMLAEREKNLESKRKESEQQALAECSFAPKRLGAKTSDLYLKRMGRAKLTPEDLFRFDEEKQRRIEVRKQIVAEMEGRELTFRPQLSEKSIKLHERLVQKGAIDIDPDTRTAVPSTGAVPPAIAAAAAVAAASVGNDYGQSGPSPSARKHGELSLSTSIALSKGDGGAWQYKEGPMLQIESEHPYRHNTNEYTTVQVPNAVSYSITFTENTRTEPIYDYVKFFDDETHTEYFGCGKYSGGMRGSSCNWPGVGKRPPLVIPASKFIIHFKTNGSGNDWGFCMHVVPILCVAPGPRMRQLERERQDNTHVPSISDTARYYQGRGAGEASGKQPPLQVHDRLYKDAVDRTTEHHNVQVDLMQNKLNVPLKPWENVRTANPKGGAAHAYVKKNQHTHLPKSSIADVAESLVVETPTPSQRSGSAAASVSYSQHPHQQQHQHHQQQLAGVGAASQTNNSMLIGASVAGGSALSATTVIEFDDSLSNLWRQLRTL